MMVVQYRENAVDDGMIALPEMDVDAEEDVDQDVD